MSILFYVLSVIFILLCVAINLFILRQQKRTAGLGSIAGIGNTQQTYWDKNKGRSMEGRLERYTKIGGALFFIMSLLLCIVK